MAFYNQADDEDQEQQVENQQAVQTGGQGGTISTGVQTASDNKAAAAGTAQGKTAASSAPTFAGINDYLNANKTQAEKLGNQVSGRVSDMANTARESVGNFQNAANEQIKAPQAISGDVFNVLQSGAEQLTPEQRELLKNTSTSQYRGPQDYTGLGDSYSNAAKNVQDAQTAIQNTQTEQGRVDLLSQIGGGKRSQGINTFDAALLSAGGGRQKLEDVSAQNKDLGDVFNAAKEDITSKIGRYDDPNTPENEAAGAMGQTQKEASLARKAIQDAMSAWSSSFNPKVTQAQQNLIARQNALFQDVGNNPYSLTEDNLQLLGLKEGDQLYNVDLNKFLTQVDPSQINASNVASAEDYARYFALSELMGQEPTILQKGNESLAGTAPSVQVDTTGLHNAIAQSKDPYIQMQYNSYQLPPLPASAQLRTNVHNGITGRTGTVMSPAQLAAAIADFENNIIPGASSSNVRNILIARANEAKKILSNWETNILPSLTRISKEG